MKSISRLTGYLVLIMLSANLVQAQNHADKLFEFLQETYNQQDKKLHDFLIVELNHYLHTFPDGEHAAEAQYLVAKVYEAKGKEPQAFAAFMKTMYLYPNSSKHEECARAVRKIIAKEKPYAQRSEELLATVDGLFGSKGGADGYFDYLRFLVELKENKLNDWALNETREFQVRFPRDPRLDQVMTWTADLYGRKGDHRQAAASYLKLDYAFPDSPLLPYTRYNRGLLLYKKLGEPEKANETFRQVVALHPESAHAGDALFMAGEVKEKKLKDYSGAIVDYRRLVNTYADHVKAVEALFAIARIHEKNLNNPAAAIVAYNEVVEKYPENERGIKALKRAGDLYKNKLKQFDKAAEQYARIAEVYPDYEKAPDMILEAGSVCEDKLEDYQKAIDYYEILLEKFPNHKKANEANRRIDRALEKLNP